MDQTDPWQVVSRQIFNPYDCLMISEAFVVLCRVGCLWLSGMCNGKKFSNPSATILSISTPNKIVLTVRI